MFASRQAKTQRLCSDDHESISGLTGNFLINCTDAFKYLNNEPLGDAGSKFMLWQSCPVTCGTCIINCESNALVTYTGKVAGTCSRNVLINGQSFEDLKDAVIMPGPVDRKGSHLTSSVAFARAGTKYVATLHTRDAYGNKRTCDPNILSVTSEAVSVNSVNMDVEYGSGANADQTKLSFLPRGTGKYIVRAYLDTLVVSSEVPLTVTAAAPVAGVSAYASPANVIVGTDLAILIRAIDMFGNTYSDGGYGYTFECLAYDVDTPTLITTPVQQTFAFSLSHVILIEFTTGF